MCFHSKVVGTMDPNIRCQIWSSLSNMTDTWYEIMDEPSVPDFKIQTVGVFV